MRRLAFLLLFIVLLCFPLFSQDMSITSEISRTEIKIGEKITLTTTIPGLKDARILWEEMTESDLAVEIINKQNSYENDILSLEVVFSFFEPGEYKDFALTIPIVDSDGELLYLETKKYTIQVNGVLTEEEIEALKKIKDTAKVELKSEKKQAKIRFKISGILLVVLFLLILLLISMVLYYFLYKYLMKKKTDARMVTLPPYQKFLVRLEQIRFERDENRTDTEQKLSGLTEALKELLFGELDFNAPSETTRELVETLKEIELDDLVQFEIYTLFTELDMIKFARAEVDYKRLSYFKKTIQSLGKAVHDETCAKRARSEGQNSRQIESR